MSNTETGAATANPPTGYCIQQAMSVWQSTRARLLAEDPDLAGDEDALAELLGPEIGDIRSIAVRLVQAIAHADNMAAAAKAMALVLSARKSRYEARHEAYRRTLFAIMDALGEKKMELPNGTVSLAAGTDVAFILDETSVPDRFVTIVTKRIINTKQLLVALKDGEVINGAKLGKSLPSLRIRT